MSHVGNLRRQINLGDATIHITVRRPDQRTMHKMRSSIERRRGSPSMKQGPKIAAAGLFAVLISMPLTAFAKDFKTETVTLSAETIADGLDHPWGLAFLPDDALLVTERGGTMRIVKDGKVSKPVANVPKVVVKGERRSARCRACAGLRQEWEHLFQLHRTTPERYRYSDGARASRSQWRRGRTRKCSRFCYR